MNYKQMLNKVKQLQPIDNALVSTLYTLSIKSQSTAIIFIILVTIFLYSELAYSIVIWGTVSVALFGFRIYQAHLFKTTPHKYSIKVWHKKFMIFASLSALMVSSLSFVFMPYLDEYHQLFVLASLVGSAGIAITSLSSDFRIALVYISLIMVPLIVSLLVIKTSLALMLAILMILFFMSQIGMIFNNYVEQQKVKELKDQKDLLHNLFSEAPLGMFSYDTDLQVLDANKHLHAMFGHKDKTIIGMNIDALSNRNILDVFKNTFTQGPQSYRGSYTSLNGNHFWLEVTAFSLKNSNNNIIGGIGIIEDKTKENMDKKELVSLYETLQAQVEENQFLLKENKLFIADMVHQIRTPLSVIMINSSLIEMETKNQVSFYVAQINSAINMLSNSYEDLNYIISSDTIEYKAMEINLTEFLNERIDFFEVIAQANDKTIYTNIADDVKVTMNDTELERLIDNNLANAIKHSYDKSGIEIVLEKNHSEIILKFISKGKGIRDIAKIFDKNYTESYHAKRNLGLGLHMVKSICEKSHINYSVHSEDETNIFTYVFNG